MIQTKRYLTDWIQRDLQKKMVFLAGPRQSGKTSLASQLLHLYYPDKAGLYLNWDDVEHQQRILKRSWSDENRLIIFDEIHKYKPWKRWIKGLYDTTKSRHSYLVTGSARLDIYKKGGDSLLGRYHQWRLHPFTLEETVPGISTTIAFERLMTVGGFPEPFLSGDITESNRWRRNRLDLIIKQDVRDLEQIQNIQGLSLFLETLRRRAGGLIVLANIEKELQISQKTLKRWITLLENMYLIFTVKSYTKAINRAIQKPFKVYFYDNADVIASDERPDEIGARFENLVATHLLKRAQFLEDSTGDAYELRYLRDKEKREVDFVILKNQKMIELIEAKWSDPTPSTSLKYYAERLKPNRAIQIVGQLHDSRSWGKIEVVRAVEELSRPLGKSW